jgi:hypothetical protein
VIVALGYVLSFDPFPTVDIASHLASARGMVDFLRGPSALAERMLEWHFLPVPNLLPQLALALRQKLKDRISPGLIKRV